MEKHHIYTMMRKSLSSLTNLLDSLGALSFFKNKKFVLMFHGVPSLDSPEFDRHNLETVLKWISEKKFPLIDLKSSDGSNGFHLTFDDGFNNNFEIVLPLIEKYSIPATFFCCDYHLGGDKFLWFTYFRALRKLNNPDLNSVSLGKTTLNQWKKACFDKEVDFVKKHELIANDLPNLDRFIDQKTLDLKFRGLSRKNLYELGNHELVTIGGHTTHHPFLSRLTRERQELEILGNKKILEDIIEKPIKTFAYPSGDYNLDTLNIVKKNFTSAYAVNTKLNRDPDFEVPRIGIYNPSLSDLKLKLLHSLIASK